MRARPLPRRSPAPRAISRRRVLGGAAALVPAVALPHRASAQVVVDLALVLLVDGSGSISDRMRGFQLGGHAGALRAQSVAEAITGGPVGRSAVTLAGFSDPGPLNILVPWRVLNSPAEVLALADEIEEVDWIQRGSTALGSALQGALRLMREGESEFGATRRVVDVSANGFSNAGPPPETVHSALNEAEVVVNGLVILDEYPWLGQYFTDSVITGPGAFVREVFDPESYQTALIQKLVHEIV